MQADERKRSKRSPRSPGEGAARRPAREDTRPPTDRGPTHSAAPGDVAPGERIPAGAGSAGRGAKSTARSGRSALKAPAAPARRPRARGEAARQQKLAAILGAALDVFAEKGYAETRLEDVARRAGVAKGTIYLYVPSKEALFEQLVRSGIATPIAAAEERLIAFGGSAEEALRILFTTLRVQILATRKHEIARIVLAEAGRFPDLADFYYREVVSRGMQLIRGIAERGLSSGEFRSDALVRFPQLAIAPGIVALIWTSLFGRIAPLDAEAMLEAHLQLLMRGLKGEPS